MILLRALLFPFSILYDLVTRFRNHLYDIGYKKSFRFDTAVVSVGNLNVGGSGKSPMIEHMARLLIPQHSVAILSRGYGRTTRGLRFASKADTAATLGDEPYQFFRKFGNDLLVTVGEDRAFAIPNILHQQPTPDVILLDDAFQHRSIEPQLSVLLTEFAAPFFSDFVLPVGNLREARVFAKRSDIVVVTKCPAETSESQRSEFKKAIHRYAPDVPVFFTGLNYEEPVAFGASTTLSGEVILVTGIANTKPLVEYIQSRFTLVRHFSFRDHHSYTLREVQAIHDASMNSNRPVSVITTEKDMVRLIDPRFSRIIGEGSWFYLPVRISFLNHGAEFDRLVLQVMKQDNKRS